MVAADQSLGAARQFPPDPVIEAYKTSLDRTLLKQNLQRTPDERLRNLIELQRMAREVRRAGKKARSAP